MDGCEVRPCDPFARVRPCVPCVPCSTFAERRDAFKASVAGVFPVGGLTSIFLLIVPPARIRLFSVLVAILFASAVV